MGAVAAVSNRHRAEHRLDTGATRPGGRNRHRAGYTPTEFARSAILETVQLQRALTAEDRADVLAAAEAEGLSLTAFCRAAILDAAQQPEPGPQIETGGVGFLAWLLAMLSAGRRAGTNA